MLRPDIFCFGRSREKIDRPIFLVGLQGNGATFVSRVLRRIDNVVTLSGNHRYWSGADEMQSALSYCLPAKYSRLTYKTPYSSYFGNRRGWMYASDDQLPFYKFTEADYIEKEARQFKNVVRGLIRLNSLNKNSNVRFLDKSQSYALKIPLLRKSLKDECPKFIGIIRNPYVACFRAATIKSALSNENLSTDFKIKTAAQHWNNTVNALIESQGHDLVVYRIEDILMDFERSMYKIAEFCELNLEEKHFPHAKDKIPYGSKRKERWYPLRKDISSRYLSSLPHSARLMITDICRDNINAFGYAYED